jgi:hypothetical protein
VSFIQGAFAPKPLHTREQVMAMMIAVADELNMPDKRGACIIAGMTVSQEVGAGGQFWCPGNHADPCFDADPDRFPHDSLGNDSRSVGLYQQQTSGPNDPNPWGWGGLYGDPEGTRKRMDLHDSTVLFMGSLKRSPYAANNALEANKWAQTVQRSGVPDAYAKHWGPVNELYDRVAKGQPPVPAAPDNRPDFNEIDQIGWDHEDPHGSIRSRPPINWFIHTQEANSNATDLAAWMRSTTGNNAVSYHYTVHEDPNDHGVTVVDVIDTDLYSWSVLDANVFSINGCFAGSFAGWTREQWLSKFGRAIDVMAYLAVQDCKKYPTISANVIIPPYATKGPGISDHKFVTQALGIGNHTDVGNGFPWDVFTVAVRKYVEGTVPPPDVPSQPPPKQLTDRQLLQENWDQLRGIDGKGWPQLGGQTLVNALGEVRDKVCGTTDYHDWKVGQTQ